MTTLADTGLTITIIDGNESKTIDYYTLTKTQGTNSVLTIKLDDANGTALSTTQVLKGTNIYAEMSVSEGYTPSMTVGGNPFTSGNTFIINEPVEVVSRAIDETKPIVEISREDYNTFKLVGTDSVGVVGYQMTNTPEVPTTWISRSSATTATHAFNIDSQAEKEYYVWVKDAAGNISEPKSITSHLMTRNQGEGTNLITRLDGSNSATGVLTTSNTIVLDGTPIWVCAEAAQGFNTVSLKKNGVFISTEGAVHTINETTIFESTATANNAIITVNKDNDVWNNNEIKVALYQNGTLKYSFENALVSGATIQFSDVVNGTYDIYASIATADKTSLINTSKTITISNNNAYETIDYYTLTKTQGENTTLTINLDNVSGVPISTTEVLKGTRIYAEAIPANGYSATITLNGNQFTSGNTFTINAPTEVISSAADTIKPTVSISRRDYSSFNWSAEDAG